MFRTLLRIVAVSLALVLTAPVAHARDAGSADTTGMDWGQVPEYRIVPGDLINLNFGPRVDQPGDLVRAVRVRPDGRVSVFPVGDVIAAGRTPRELEGALVALLAQDLRNPRVVCEVAEFAGNQVHVLGQVKDPRSVPATPFMTVLQAIAGAGGFQNDAARNSVLVIRRDGARNVRVVRLRLDKAMKSGDLSQDVRVGRFDIVYVPRSTISNVDLFTRQLLAGPQMALGMSIQGWELFNLDRIYLLTGH